VITVWFGNPKVLYIKRTAGAGAAVLKATAASFTITGKKKNSPAWLKRILVIGIPVGRNYLTDLEPVKLHLFVAFYHLNHYVHGGSAPGQTQ
jgi:hypothetical protein